MNDSCNVRFVGVDGRMEEEKFVRHEDVKEFTARNKQITGRI